MTSLFVGMYAFVMKSKIAVWFSLFLFFTSSINARSDGRLQQIFTGFSIILISFVNVYFAPNRPTGALPFASEPELPS